MSLFESGNFNSITYDEAHNIIYGAIAYAEELGINPDKSFAITQYLLEEDTEDMPLIEYEFGKDDKPFLVTYTRAEANRYLPTLRKNVGEGNFDFFVEEDDYNDDDYDDDDDKFYGLDNMNMETMLNNLKKMEERIERAKGLTHTPYTYQHPAYPDELTLVHQELLALTLPENNMSLPKEIIDSILGLPRETLLKDLENLILYEIGKTYKEIPDEMWNIEESCLIHALFILGELRAEESLPVILECMRQGEQFFEYHFGDIGNSIVPLTLYYTGRNQLPALFDYMKEPGLYPFFRAYSPEAVATIAQHEPERRGEAIEWYRELLLFYIENFGNGDVYDATLAGMMMSPLLDIKAKELLPEIKQLYDTGQVDDMCCGDYHVVLAEMNSRKKPLNDRLLLNIYERYRMLN